MQEGGGGLDDSLRLDVVEIARPLHTSESVSFLVGLRTYQYAGRIFECSSWWYVK